MPKPKPIRERAVRIQAIRVRSAAARLRSLASSLVTFFAVDRSLIADADPCRPGRSYTRGATLAGLDIVAEQALLSQPQRQQLHDVRVCEAGCSPPKRQVPLFHRHHARLRGAQRVSRHRWLRVSSIL